MIDKAKEYDIFFVDDDLSVHPIVVDNLKCIGKVKCFARAMDCLEQLSCKNCNLLITAVKIAEMDGLALLGKVKQVAPWVPVILVTGYGNISMCSRAFKMGAVDFIEKPLEKEDFLQRVKTVLVKNYSKESNVDQPLTKTEKKVLKLVFDGEGNKQIARKLNRSLRSVERHRSSIMHKFKVDNIVDLVKKSILISLDDIE